MDTWSDKKLRTHKNAQAALSAGGAVLGIGALGSKGVAVGAGRALKAKSTGLRKVPQGTLKRVEAGGNRAAGGLTIGSAGVGGFSGLNFAGIQRTEAKRRVQKNAGGSMDFGLGGVHQGVSIISKAGPPLATGAFRQTKPTSLKPKLNVPKSPTQPKPMRALGAGPTLRPPSPGQRASTALKRPGVKPALGAAGGAAGGGGAMALYNQRSKQRGGVAKAYDPERKRARRLEGYSTGLNMGAGALAVGSTMKTVQTGRELKANSKKKSVPTASLKRMGRSGAAAAGLGLGAVGAAYGADRVKSYSRGAGRTYRPLRGT